MDNILSAIGEVPQEVAMDIARQVKARRLEINLTQEGLCVRAGIKVPTYQRFERTGEISLKRLLQIAFALNALRDFEGLFAQKQYQSLEEVLAKSNVKRKRGKKNE